jgi:hypothetical protein
MSTAEVRPGKVATADFNPPAEMANGRGQQGQRFSGSVVRMNARGAGPSDGTRGGGSLGVASCRLEPRQGVPPSPGGGRQAPPCHHAAAALGVHAAGGSSAADDHRVPRTGSSICQFVGIAAAT